MLATIHVHVGAKTKNLKLQLPTIVGRGGSSKIKLPASTVSRQHCEIYNYEGQIAIRDLGSSNGTFVNGHRISEATFVGPEDVLKVGPLVFSVEPLASDAKDTSATKKPTPDRPPAEPIPEPKAEKEEAAPAEEVAVPKIVDPEEVAAPTFEELPAETVEPVSSKATPIDVTPMEEEDDDASVLQYAKPKDEGGRSFVGIEQLGEAPPQAESSAPSFEGVEESKDSVETDESALQDFFKNLE